MPKPSPTWDGQGYTKADYKDRVGDLPIWIGYVRTDSAAGYELTVATDLSGLQHRFEAIGVMPAPPGVGAASWYASTTTLAKFAGLAAADWDSGDFTGAMARFEVVVENSNNLVTEVNDAFHLHIRKS